MEENKDVKSPEEQEKRTLNNCGCPLGNIPANIWRDLLRPPFRKRHPFWFWTGMIVLVFLLAGTANMIFADEENTTGECIALVTVQGPIMDAKSTLAWIHKLEKNPDVKGVLVRVNSPGGGASSSQEIYAALARMAKKVPVAASMGATAASGGLMVSMAAEKVFANAATVTGSIGVRMDIPQLEGLMSKIGIGQETLVTAPYKDAASYMRPLTEKDREYLQGVLMNMHEQFVNIVAEGRHMDHEKAASLANGKIYTGQQALELGLVDSIGGEYEAMQWLARKTGVPESKKLLKKTENTRSRLLDSILGMSAMLLLDRSGEELLELKERWTQPTFLYQAF